MNLQETGAAGVVVRCLNSSCPACLSFPGEKASMFRCLYGDVLRGGVVLLGSCCCGVYLLVITMRKLWGLVELEGDAA